MGEGSAQSAVRSADPRLQNSSTGVSSSPPPFLVLLGNTPLVCSMITPPHKEKPLAKPAYPLFSNVIGNAKGSLKSIEGDLSKGGGLEKTIPRGEETAINIKVLPITAPFVVSGGSCPRIFDPTSASPESTTMNVTSSSLYNPLILVSTAGATNGAATMEELMARILVELRAIKLSQEETRRETKDQLNQINTHLTLLSTRVLQVEQRVSDIEDAENQVETSTSRIQSELEDLQTKLDEMENKSQRSNLRFVGVPEESDAASSVTKVGSELICKAILLDRAKTEGDLSIMRAHRVPFMCPANSKYPRTILVNFGEFRIKEQIIFQARKACECM
ncbi:hypothetical protein NDU88_002928 [Pleurodeles waltl]|uniref:Uncharacterized protein n=1 Tax=Pleurodeles waltl TaxID=8319 RepID=A0AAV7P851_PLEWA|nr:hypothetical protein NDU88_002928 [Pleurodeles waltl]